MKSFCHKTSVYACCIDYTKEQQVRTDKIPVCLSKYKHIFYSDFNLNLKTKEGRLQQVRQLQLDATKDKPEEHQDLLTSTDKHQVLAQNARDLLKSDRQIARINVAKPKPPPSIYR